MTDTDISYVYTPVHECIGAIDAGTSVVNNTYYVSEEPTYMAAKGLAITDAELKAATSLPGYDATIWSFPSAKYPSLINNP